MFWRNACNERVMTGLFTRLNFLLNLFEAKSAPEWWTTFALRLPGSCALATSAVEPTFFLGGQR